MAEWFGFDDIQSVREIAAGWDRNKAPKAAPVRVSIAQLVSRHGVCQLLSFAI
jgi:hypothetical protein